MYATQPMAEAAEGLPVLANTLALFSLSSRAPQKPNTALSCMGSEIMMYVVTVTKWEAFQIAEKVDKMKQPFYLFLPHFRTH